jgi:hypothetical protein
MSEYRRIVALVAANGGMYPSGADDLSVAEALLQHTKHAATRLFPLPPTKTLMLEKFERRK